MNIYAGLFWATALGTLFASARPALAGPQSVPGSQGVLGSQSQPEIRSVPGSQSEPETQSQSVTQTTTIVLMPFKAEQTDAPKAASKDPATSSNAILDANRLNELKQELGEAVIARFVRIANTKIINLAASPQSTTSIEGDHFITGRITIEGPSLKISARIFDRAAKKIIWTAEAQGPLAGREAQSPFVLLADRLGHYYQPPPSNAFHLHPFASLNTAGGGYIAAGGGLFYKNWLLDTQFGTYGLDTGSETQANVFLRISGGYHYLVGSGWSVGMEGLFLLYRTTRLNADFSYSVYGLMVGGSYRWMEAIQIFPYYSPQISEDGLAHRLGFSARYIFY